MIRCIATDIDGTLLQHNETAVSEQFFRQARRLMESGIAFCAASGRQYSSLRRVFPPIADEMYYICENGAAVFGPGPEPILLSKSIIDRQTSLALCREILDIPGCELLISGLNTSYLIPKTQAFEDHIRYFVGNHVEILTCPEDMPEDFLKISAWYASGAEEIAPRLRPRWQDRFQVAIAGFCWLDFTIADKGTGIRVLCDALHIRPDEIMAFGDNYNDVPMLDAVGSPVIMSGAAPELLARYPIHSSRPEAVLEQL